MRSVSIYRFRDDGALHAALALPGAKAVLHDAAHFTDAPASRSEGTAL